MPIEMITFGERTCKISKSTLGGTLRGSWPSQLVPASINWTVNIECESTELFEGYLIEPKAVFAFSLKERINWKQIAPAILAAQNNLYGEIYFQEHFDAVKVQLRLQWCGAGELEVSGEFEGEFERDVYGFGRLTTLARWGGIRMLDVGEMTVDQAREILETIFDTTEMTAERIDTPRIDGRPYADVVFSSVWP